MSAFPNKNMSYYQTIYLYHFQIETQMLTKKGKFSVASLQDYLRSNTLIFAALLESAY